MMITSFHSFSYKV